MIRHLHTIQWLMVLAACLLIQPMGVSASDVWPKIVLPTPKNQAFRHYLGIDNAAEFTLDRIQAKVVLVQIYSMYCPICQREAKRVNDLYHLIAGNSKLAPQIKIVAIGVGNSNYEVDFYRKTYDVPFPLFADGDFSIHKQLGEVRTPYFYVLTHGKDQGMSILSSKAGGFKSAEHFLNTLTSFLK